MKELVRYLLENLFIAANLQASFGIGPFAQVPPIDSGASSLRRIELDSSIFYPWDTYLLLVLWAWCGVRASHLGPEKRSWNSL